MLRYGTGVLAFLFSTSNLLAGGPLNSFQVGQWQAGAYTDPAGEFSHCAAVVPYQSGITLFVSVNSSWDWSLGFTHPSWELGEGETIPIDMTFDREASFRVVGTALRIGDNATTNFVAVPMPSGFQDQFGRAQIMQAFAKGNSFSFELTSVSQLVPALTDCVQNHLATDPPALHEAAQLNEQALQLEQQSRHADAELLYQRALALREKTLGPDHVDVAQSLNNLAALYDTQGRYGEAEPLYKRALEIRERSLGPDHWLFAQSLNNLAFLYNNQGRFAEAEPLYIRSLGIRQKAFGSEHPEVATVLNNLAALYEKQRRYGEAEPLYKRVLEIREKTFGPDHTDVAYSLTNLGSVYRAQGRYAEAEPLWARALTVWEKVVGADGLDVAMALYNLAVLFHDLSRYAEAEPLYKRALAIREAKLGPDSPEVAFALNSLALLYKEQSRYAEAEPVMKRALTIREKVLGGNHRDFAKSLISLGTLYEDRGLYAEAEPLYKRALAINEKLLDDEGVALSVNNLGLLYYRQGRYADAERLVQRALAIAEKNFGSDHSRVGLILNNLAELYRNQGRYEDSKPLYERALMIREKVLGSDHPDVAVTNNNLAMLYMEQGHYADTEPLLKRALAIQEKSLGPDHPNVAMSVNNLGYLYDAQGRYQDADVFHKRALAIYDKALGPDHPNVAMSLNNLGQLYVKRGDIDAAELLFKRAMTIYERSLSLDHPNVAMTLNNLAFLYGGQNRYADAEPLFKRALTIHEKSLGPYHPKVGLSLNNLAVLFTQQGHYAEAEPLNKRALAIREKALGPDHPDVAQSLNNLGDVYRRQGRYADAEPPLKRATVTLEKSLGANHPWVGLSLNSLALLYDDQFRYSDAFAIVRRTIDQRTATPDPTLSILLNAQRAGVISAAQSFSDSYRVLQASSSSTAAEAVKKLAQRFAAESSELSELVRKDQDLAAEVDRVDKSLIAAVSKEPNERNKEAEEKIRKRLAEISSERKTILDVLAQEFPDYVALANPQPLTLQETQDMLADDEVVVAFDIGEKSSYAWVVSKEAASWTEIPTDAKTLREEIRKLRQSLTFATNQPFDPTLSYQVYQQTFGPIADKLVGKTRLSVLANGALTSIPFGILITSDPQGKRLKDADWLVKSYAVTVLPSIYSLKTMRAQVASAEARKPMIAFADPVFAKGVHAKAKPEQVAMRSLSRFYRGSQLDVASLAESLPQLPGTRIEVEAIAESLKVGKGDLKLGLNATEQAVKQSKLDEYRVVYFATHGLVAGELQEFAKAKAEPALALTIPDKPSDLDDGLLEASEVAKLKMNADWVVLSACNTASSDGVGAEPLSGLARAFLYAGGRSLVVSHWDVSDEATARLMSDLFAISKNKPNLSHGEMMRQATLNLLDAARTDNDAHPRVWAPFVVVGEPARVH